MKCIKASLPLFLFCLTPFILDSCSSTGPSTFRPYEAAYYRGNATQMGGAPADYASRLPQHLDTGGQKVVLVDPNVHAFGAYGPDGNLEHAGLAVAGADYCPDLGRRCHTKSGTFRVSSLGSASCKSSLFPMPHGGAPMPYCMFFNKNQALHGSHEGELREANLSHGCVRLHVSDAEWLRFNFVQVGTKVVVKPY